MTCPRPSRLLAAHAVLVLAVAAGDATACELAGGIRVERRGRRLLRVPTDPLSG